jgi:hypothetical protein
VQRFNRELTQGAPEAVAIQGILQHHGLRIHQDSHKHGIRAVQAVRELHRLGVLSPTLNILQNTGLTRPYRRELLLSVGYMLARHHGQIELTKLSGLLAAHSQVLIAPATSQPAAETAYRLLYSWYFTQPYPATSPIIPPTATGQHQPDGSPLVAVRSRTGIVHAVPAVDGQLAQTTQCSWSVPATARPIGLWQDVALADCCGRCARLLHLSQPGISERHSLRRETAQTALQAARRGLEMTRRRAVRAGQAVELATQQVRIAERRVAQISARNTGITPSS